MASTIDKPVRLVHEADAALKSHFRHSRTLRIIAVIAILCVLGVLVVALFGPVLPYEIAAHPESSLTSEDFLRQLEAQTDSRLNRNTAVQPFPNGENFYEAELAAMRSAQRSINLEAYIFNEGQIADRFTEVLTERARAGVKVNLVLDAIGSARTSNDYFQELKDAGGRVGWYHPVRWYTWMRSNNRTHRELLIIDGTLGFIGGAGVADWWAIPTEDEPRWRDNMFRVEGDAIASLQGTFLENWLEATGEVLSGPDYFPKPGPSAGTSPSLVVNSTPSSGGSTRSRVLFQVLLASAQKSIEMATPYFVPDDSGKQALVEARQRGVDVRILVPSKWIDHEVVRATSRSTYGDLLKAGVHIYEYQPSMTHAKLLVIDDAWVVVGSTNFDNRSFGINDEVNLAVRDPQLASRMTALFKQDLSASKEISFEEWQKRGPVERVQAWLGWLFERQQ